MKSYPRFLIAAMMTMIAYLPLAIAAEDAYHSPCGRSIILPIPEHAYGPPNVPDVEKSETEYKKRLSSYSKGTRTPNSVLELAYIAYAIGEEKQAERLFLKSVQLGDFKTPFYAKLVPYYLARINENRKNYPVAKKYYEELGDAYYLHLANARAFAEEGELDKAEQEYLLAQSVYLYEMYNYDPYEEMARMFFEDKQYRKAKKYIEKYLACAEYELEGGGIGYGPADDTHISKARQFLAEINARIAAESPQ